MENPNPSVNYSYKQVFVRMKNILFRPVSEWKKIGNEHRNVNEILTDYSLILIAICTITKFLNILFSVQEADYLLAVKHAVTVFLFLFGSLYLTYLFMQFFLSKTGLETEKATLFGLIAYSATPFYVINVVVNLVPELFIIYPLVLYGFYIALTGIREFFFDIKKEKAIYISIVTMLCLTVLSFLIHFFFLKLTTFQLK